MDISSFPDNFYSISMISHMLSIKLKDLKIYFKCTQIHPRKTTPSTRTTATGAIGANKKTKSGGSSSNKRAGIAVVIVFCVFVLIVIACWFAYAYTHPLSKSGMILMQVIYLFSVR